MLVKHIQQPVRAFRLGMPGVDPVIDVGFGMQSDLRPTIAIIPFSARATEESYDVLGQILAEASFRPCHRHPTFTWSHGYQRASSAGPGLSVGGDRKPKLHTDLCFQVLITLIGDRVMLKAELARLEAAMWCSSTSFTAASRLLSPGKMSCQDGSLQNPAAMMMHEVQRAQTNALPTLESYTLLLSEASR